MSPMTRHKFPDVVLVCVQTLTTLDDDHPLRKRNAEYYLKSPKAMANLFRRYPKAVATTDSVRNTALRARRAL